MNISAVPQKWVAAIWEDWDSIVCKCLVIPIPMLAENRVLYFLEDWLTVQGLSNDLQVVSLDNATSDQLDKLLNGDEIDVFAARFAYTEERFKIAHFPATPISFGGSFSLMSHVAYKPLSVHLILEIFDLITWYSILCSIVIFSLFNFAFYAVLKRRYKPFTEQVFHTMSIVSNQTIGRHITRSVSFRVAFISFVIAFSWTHAMFDQYLIGILSKRDWDSIDTLEDFLRKPRMKLAVSRQSYVYRSIVSNVLISYTYVIV